jgi:two-component system sensor histidine kinase DctS
LLAGLAGLMAGLWIRSLWMRQQSQRAYRELESKMQANAKIATLGEMSTAIAHELNQPLGAIENYAHACERLMLRSETPSPGVLEALRQIRCEAQRGAEVIRSIRSLARRERGRVERVRLSELFDRLRPLLSIQAQRYGCEIQVETDPSLTVVCEKTLLEQVIVNLTNNGFEAMQDTPKAQRRLTLTAEFDPKEQAVSVVVSDNGAGISQKYASSLFKPFFTTKTEGLGIGLNLCQTIAEQQGGAISWHNKSERGAVFTLRLPLAQTTETL